MVAAAWAAFLGLGALAAFGLAVAAFRKWPAIPLYCLTFFAVTVWDLPNKPPMAQVAGVSIHYEDVIISIVVATIAVKPTQFWKTVKPYGLIAVLSMACFGLSLINGIATFGPNTSVNEFRGFFYTVGMVAWFLNQDWLDDAGKRRFRRWCTVTGIAVSIAAATHIALYGLGKADSFVVSAVSGDEMTSRPLT